MGQSGEYDDVRRLKRDSDEACRRLASRVREQGVRLDVRLAILDLLSSEGDTDDLRDELDQLVARADEAARAFSDRARGA